MKTRDAIKRSAKPDNSLLNRLRPEAVRFHLQLALTALVLGFLCLWASKAEAQNPVPFISEPLVPASVSPGGPAFTLTVNGANFVPVSIVTWNGTPRPTTYINQSQLTADISDADIARAATAWITVVNPTPGGGTSDLAFLPIASHSGAILFDKLDFPSPPDNIDFATGDFNGDGKLDLASANWHTSSVSIFLGNGDGTFQPYQEYWVCGAHGVKTGDFNGDCVADLAATARGCNEVVILIGNGDGTFHHNQNYDAPSSPYFLCVADFDSDGALDLVVCNEGACSMSVRLGRGDGTFEGRQDYPIGNDAGQVCDVATADFNYDGHLDVAVSTIEGFVAVMLGNGNGTFGSPHRYATEPGHGNTLIAVDLNKDGLADLAVPNDSGSVLVLLGRGDGTFLPYVSYQTGGGSMSIAAGDLNGDDLLDLVTANHPSATLSVLLGDDAFAFGPYTHYTAHGGPRAVCLGDFNGDGRLDVAVGDQGRSWISILVNRDVTIPSLISPPKDQTVFAGESVVFWVTVAGLDPLAYQWQFDGADLQDGDRISGSSTSTLRISPVVPADAGTYTVIVSNVHGSVTSNPAELAVLLRPPEITAQPEDQTVISGALATFAVDATGSLPMTFQWRRNGDDLNDGGRIFGAQTATLNIADAGIEDLGVYTAMISNAYGSVTSAAASLTVILQPPQISADPTDQSVYSGSDVSFGVTAVGSLPLSYQWRCNGVSLVDDGRITGSQTATLSIAAAEVQDLGLYVVEVRNAYGWTVSFPAQLTVVLAPPNITVGPQGQTVALGSTVSLHVEATGSLPLSYQWQREGVDVVDGGRFSGARTSTLTIADVGLLELGDYSVLVENALGRVQSKSVAVATFSVVLQIRREGDQVVVSWNEAGKGMMLQTASSLTNPDWQEVAASDGTTTVNLPVGAEMVFFRLAIAQAPLTTVTVRGQSNPWLAGMPFGSHDPCGVADVVPDQSPMEVSGIWIMPAQRLSFRAEGGVSNDPLNALCPPDGDASSIGQWHREGNGIAGIVAPLSSLIGVFLGPDEPDFTPAPVGLDFGAAVSRSQLSLAPGLKQPFFIGDGRTETGQVQVIFVPE
ncbi:MAG TPA: FG-GAP-like repeat-containing protein, partial [Candidatus Paceibacterota bacterium]|nr:FG-GAP-like repeat-containing protein [Candidatus Paceibacterota bacterium]